MNDLITVIIPIYNVEKYLATCLDSILGQSYPHLQIIAVNDGSTDGSLAIAEAYAAKDSRILLLSQKNRGLAMTRNVAMKHARGKWISYIDSDDSLHEDCYKNLSQSFALNPDLINFGVKVIYEESLDTKEDREHNKAYFKMHYPNGLMLLDDEIRIKTEHTPGHQIFKHALILQHQFEFLDVRFGEDFPYFWKYILIAESIYFDDKPHFNYLKRPGSLTYKAYVQRDFECLCATLITLEEIMRFAQLRKIAHLHPQAIILIIKKSLISPLYFSQPKDKNRAKLAILRTFLKIWSNVYTCRLALSIFLYLCKSKKINQHKTHNS